MPLPRASVAGESVLWVDPAEVPADADLAGLGRALVAGRHGDRDELMAVIAAYSGLRWGELAALTIAQVHPCARVIREAAPLPEHERAGQLGRLLTGHDLSLRTGLPPPSSGANAC